MQSTSKLYRFIALIALWITFQAAGTPAFAQPSLVEREEESLTSMTLKAGRIRSDMYSFDRDAIDDVRITPQTGMSAGLSLCLGISRVFAIQPEVMYSVKGAQVLQLRGNTTQNLYDIKLSYLEIPILFKFVAPIGKAVRGNLYFGPFGAVNCENNSRLYKVIPGTNTVISSEEPTEFNRDFIPFDAGAILGGGMSVRMLGAEMMVDARFSLSAVPLTDGDEVMNRTFSLMLGITF
ncbi:MAG: porin family protein [Candidatus Kapaibacterium sp.]